MKNLRKLVKEKSRCFRGGSGGEVCQSETRDERSGNTKKLCNRERKRTVNGEMRATRRVNCVGES